jgi:hypothetical protein
LSSVDEFDIITGLPRNVSMKCREALAVYGIQIENRFDSAKDGYQGLIREHIDL